MGSLTGRVARHTVAPVNAFLLIAITAAGFAANDSSGVLLRSFVIALVLMAPVALWQGRRVRRMRERQRSASYQEASDLSSLRSRSSPGSSTLGGDPGDAQTLESLVAEVNRVAATLDSSATAEFVVPAELTVGGSRAEPGLVEAVLRDALDRSGLEVTATDSDGSAVRLQCRRR